MQVPLRSDQESSRMPGIHCAGHLTQPLFVIHTQWENTHSLIIDFTTGDMMDREYYLSILNNAPKAGILLGKMNEEALKIAWKIVQLRQSDNQNGYQISENRSPIYGDVPLAASLS